MGTYANNFNQKINKMIKIFESSDFKHENGEEYSFNETIELQRNGYLQMIAEELAHINDNLVSIATYLSKNRK